jgi:hypothetical protein
VDCLEPKADKDYGFFVAVRFPAFPPMSQQFLWTNAAIPLSLLMCGLECDGRFKYHQRRQRAMDRFCMRIAGYNLLSEVERAHLNPRNAKVLIFFGSAKFWYCGGKHFGCMKGARLARNLARFCFVVRTGEYHTSKITVSE